MDTDGDEAMSRAWRLGKERVQAAVDLTDFFQFGIGRFCRLTVRPMVFLFDSSGTENAEAGSGMGVELLVDFGVGDVGKVLG